MGMRLAVEIVAYCRTNIPTMLHNDNDNDSDNTNNNSHNPNNTNNTNNSNNNMNTHGNTPRVSFIGHSAGGLIIRRCLEEISMKPLLHKLHVYMSLATPHMGTLFAESQLVATGMWAMLKYGKSQLLKELLLEDGNKDIININFNIIMFVVHKKNMVYVEMI